MPKKIISNNNSNFNPDQILRAFPQINNGLMETDFDLIRSLEAVTYVTVADMLQRIYQHDIDCKTCHVSELIVWLRTREREIKNFADFAILLETSHEEICSLFKYWLWPTVSYLKIYNTPYGTLELKDNIEAVIALLNKSTHPKLGSLLIDCRDFGYLSHLIDYIYQVVEDDPSWEVFNLQWEDFIELLSSEKESINHFLDTESCRWLYK